MRIKPVKFTAKKTKQGKIIPFRITHIMLHHIDRGDGDLRRLSKLLKKALKRKYKSKMHTYDMKKGDLFKDWKYISSAYYSKRVLKDKEQMIFIIIEGP